MIARYLLSILLFTQINFFAQSDQSATNFKPRIGVLLLDKPIKSSWSVLSPLLTLCTESTIESIILIVDYPAIYTYAHALALSRDITELKRKYNKKIIVYSEVELIGPSYVLACAADTIITLPVTVIGALGIAWNIRNLHKKNEHEGTLVHLFASGAFKALSDPNIPSNPEHVTLRQNQVNLALGTILHEIVLARPALKDALNLIKNGEVYIAAQPESTLLIDAIGDRFDAFKYALGQRQYQGPVKLEELDIVQKTISRDKQPVHPATKQRKLSIGIMRITNLDRYSWQYSPYILELMQDPYIDAVVLAIDSPGGLSALGNALYGELNKLKSAYKKPLVAYVDNLALSAAYHVACAADYIIAAPNALVGSVGSRIERWDISQQETRQYISHSNVVSGIHMNAYNKYIPLSQQDKQMIDRTVKATHGEFIKHVLAARPHLDTNKHLWAESQVYQSQQALELGLIDAIGSPLEVIKKLNSNNYALDEIELIIKEMPKNSPAKKKKYKRSLRD